MTPVSLGHTNNRACLASLTADVCPGPELYARRIWYDSPNVATALVASGLMTLTTVLAGSAAGVRTTDMSRPPDTRSGATFMGNVRACAGGSGV